MSSRYSSSGKKSSRRTETQWSAWGQWVWSTTYNRYYRQRQDINGNRETMWATEHTNVTADTAEQPRQQAPYEPGGDDEEPDVADQLKNLGLDDPGGDDEEEELQYSHRQGSSAYSSSHDSYDKRKSSTSRASSSSKTSSSSRSKKSTSAASSSGKGKYVAYDADSIEEQEEDEPEPYYGSSARDATSRESAYDQSTYAGYSYADDPASTSAHKQGYATGAGYSSAGRTYQQAYEEPDETDDQQYAQAVHESQAHYQQAYRGGESSRHQSSRSRHAQAETDEASESNVTPRGGGQFDISGRNEGDYEHLDPRYRVEPSHKFQPGEVFKVLWPEPTGHALGGTPTISDRQKIPDNYGGNFYVGFRRFIVIANDAGHCTCVPILTYGGKGCKKKGIKPEKHGIIAEVRHRARPLDGEPKMKFPPVHLVIEVEGERLAPESRVNYSKLVTVEHNVKVFFIGHIVPKEYQLVADAVNSCWEDKIHQRKKHTR